jgi:RNA polymerase sigma factor (sigma-70 family)
MERECWTDIATPVRCSLVEGQAFEAAFTTNFQYVHRFLARRVGSALADDLAAETFAIAFRRRESFDASLGEVRAWLFGITTNLLRAHWREEQHLLALEARIVGEPSAPTTESDDEALARWIAPRLARALGLLSQDQRDVLLLHAWADLSSEEIANIMSVPAGTIRSRLSRARAELRDYLGNFDFDLWLFDEQPTPTQEDPER